MDGWMAWGAACSAVALRQSACGGAAILAQCERDRPIKITERNGLLLRMNRRATLHEQGDCPASLVKSPKRMGPNLEIGRRDYEQ